MMYNTDVCIDVTGMGREEIENQISILDTRVKNLEKDNDSWMATHGCMNESIYDLIQAIMDERDRLFFLARRM